MMENEWKWYWSTDGGEYCHGPCDTREEAIDDAQANDGDVDGQSFTVLEATKGRLRPFIDRNLGDWLDDRNQEQCDPEGDSISASVTELEWQDLSKRLDKAAAEWIDAHNLHEHVWMFDQMRNEEEIPARDEK